MTKGFRFGVQIRTAGSLGDWASQAREAERLGYDIINMPDHIGEQLDPFPALVAAAAATERLRVGTFVLDNDFRHPLLVAREAATVHLLTEGRLELGIGAGWLVSDYERLGIPFDPPGVRVGRLTEAVSIIESYFRGETFSFEGEHYTVRDVEPVHLGAGRPPLLIGGGGPRILELAGRHADIVSVFLRSKREGSGFQTQDLTPESYDRQIQRVRSAARERADDLELNILVQDVVVTDQRQQVAGEHAGEYGGDVEDFLALPFELIGTHDEMANDLLTRRDRYGLSYVTVFAKNMRDFAPVIDRLKKEHT